ncbi:hypothetical protein [Pseudomonas sp. Q2-TVG4-2]|uniref:hypothetical protein n=1 Tax=Pseudomonas sp. Q2-TVG4-2 TaxID=1685699 RepID=UPI0015E6774E|nr:hypothetical protein [Pseudomonas sp. Q2-TVG4-2]
MQRYHQPSVNALPTCPAHLETESQRLAEATEAFLAKGGQIQAVGNQMKDSYPAFVINPAKTPVYAHLFEHAKALSAFPVPIETLRVLPEPSAVAAQPEADQVQLSDAQLAGKVMAKDMVGHPPKRIGEQLNLSEKKVRQLCRDYNITVRQR